MVSVDITDKYPIGSRPPIHYLAYLIFISYVVSLIGAFTTVELLHRRITGAGWRNWTQLAACSVSFGLVSIWCMHFVGNRAIVLGNGEEAIQLYYNPTYTAVSAILPIIVIFLGFLVVDRFFKGSKSLVVRYFALAICGICTGAAVTEMHYLGNNGTVNYRLIPALAYIVGAAAIAIGACSVAFTLFFLWSSLWINTLWRRFIVSCVLAGAVSGMHWTAAAGTAYELRGYHGGSGNAKNVNLIIAVCLCLAACGVCFAIGLLKQRQNKKHRDRAQQVVLAIATFDAEGRLLVTQGGLLPCQTITRQFHRKTFDEEFNTAHPVFQWIFRVSRHWGGVVDLVPSMRDHLLSTGYLQMHTPVVGTGGRPSMEMEDNSSYPTTFRELFCVTAQEIARTLDTRLQDLGSLYEDVLTTGTLLNRSLWNHGNKTIMAADVVATPGDVEAGFVNPILFGKGQMLVLTRKVGTEETNRLQNNGYRFATVDQIRDPLARSLQISRDDLNNLIKRLQISADRRPWVPAKGTYLASFLLQPSPVMKGLDVIVDKATPDRLPVVRLTSEEMGISEIRVLSHFNGLTLDECLARINQHTGIGSDNVFLEKFRNKILELTREVSESALHQAIFSAQPLDALHGMNGQNEKRDATVFAFCGIREVYQQNLQSKSLRYVPLSFFKTQQRIYPGCPDHAILAHKNHKEFSSLLTAAAVTQETAALPARPSSKWGLWPFVRQVSTSSETTLHPDSSSERGLVGITQYAQPEMTNASTHPLGGIMVSQEVVIDDGMKGGQHMEMTNMGVHSMAGVADEEKQTIADRLMAITTSFRDPYNRTLRDTHGRR